jgi:hypothetical protein
MHDITPSTREHNILNTVSSGCAMWILFLRTEEKLRLQEAKMPRRLLGHKRVKVHGKWRILHIKKLLDQDQGNCNGEDM